MYKIYIPENKGKNKPALRGLWKGKDKLYYDYITIKEVKSISSFDIEKIRLQYAQEALFIEADNCAYIFYNPFEIEALRTKNFIAVFNREDLKKACKKYLKDFGGCTIQSFNNGYFVISWSN